MPLCQSSKTVFFVITNQTIFWKAEHLFIEHFDYSDSFLRYVAVHIFVPELTLKIMIWENPKNIFFNFSTVSPCNTGTTKLFYCLWNRTNRFLFLFCVPSNLVHTMNNNLQ